MDVFTSGCAEEYRRPSRRHTESPRTVPRSKKARSMPIAPRLLAVATAVPPYPLDQDAVIERVRRLFGGARGARPAVAGVHQYRHPHAAIPACRSNGTTARTAGPSATASISSARSTCSRADDDPAARPRRHCQARDRRRLSWSRPPASPRRASMRCLIERMGLRADVRRLPIFGLGCAGGRHRPRPRRGQAMAAPGESRCCFWSSNCAPCRFAATISRRATSSPPHCSATAPPAALLSTAGGWPGDRRHRASTPGPARLEVMGWEVADDGLSAIFSRDIPQLVTHALSRGRRRVPRPATVWRSPTIDRFVCHPGGAKVIARARSRLRPRRRARSRARARCCATMATCRPPP